jgi:hypothetical protein
MNLELGSDGVWTGTVYFKPLSIALFDTETIFVLDASTGSYSVPAFPLTAKWQGSSGSFFIYDIVDDPQTKLPYISKIDSKTINSGEVIPVSFNFAFNPTDQFEVVSTLLICSENQIIASITVAGEGIVEDDRMRVWLENFGLKFNKHDALLLKDYDIKEALPDWKVINQKRKEIIINKEDIFPYIGTYKGLMSILAMMGYSDVLSVKEYWTNVDNMSPYYKKFLTSDVSNMLIEGGVSELESLETEAKFKNTSRFKKTGMIALSYAFTHVVEGEYDVDDLPLVVPTSEFNFNEIFYKLNGVKRMLEADFIPSCVKIVDIIGDFILFTKYTYRYWLDQATITERTVNEDINIDVIPGNRNMFVRDIKPLFSGIKFDYNDTKIYNETSINPYDDGQRYKPSDITQFADAITSMTNDMGVMSGFEGAPDYEPWVDVPDNITPTGCPIVLEAVMPELTGRDLYGVRVMDLALKTGTMPDGLTPFFTARTLKFLNMVEFEWRVTLPNKYYFKYRGRFDKLSMMPHILPYPGIYDVELRAYDFFGGISVAIEKSFITVYAKQPRILAAYVCDDVVKFDGRSLTGVKVGDFGGSMAFNPRVNLAWNSKLPNNARTGMFTFDDMFFYAETAKVMDPITGVWIPVSESTLDSVRFMPGKNRLIKVSDYYGVTARDLTYRRVKSFAEQPNILYGFKFKNPLPGDTISFGGNSVYTVPSIPMFSLDTLAANMNASYDPYVSEFNYEVINHVDFGTCIKATSKYFDPMACMWIYYTGNVVGDYCTFPWPHWLYSSEFKDTIESLIADPGFKIENMYLKGKASVIFSGKASAPIGDPDYSWYMYNNLPTVLDSDSHSIGNMKVYDGSFMVSKFVPVTFVVDNIEYVSDYMWNIYKDGALHVSIKDVPYLNWIFTDLGIYDIEVILTDGHGNIMSSMISKGINVVAPKVYNDEVKKQISHTSYL